MNSEPAPDGGCIDELSEADPVEKATNTAGNTEVTPEFRRAITHVAAVAGVEYRLAVRTLWAFALAGLFGVFGAMLLTVSGSAVGPDGVERVLASLASLSVYLVPLAALAFGYDAVVGREEQGWFDVVFALPVSRGRVVVGTYLGRAVVLAGATILGFGFTGVLLVREHGAVVATTTAFPTFLTATVALGIAFLSIATLLSTLAREKTHALGLALLVWVWFVLIHDLLALGLVAAFALPDAALSGLLLANPASVFRVLVLSGLGTTAGGGFTAAMAGAGLSQGVLGATLLAWCVIPLVAATRLVARRRL